RAYAGDLYSRVGGSGSRVVDDNERSAAAEEAIEKPTVEAAVDRLRPDRLSADGSADLAVGRRAGRGEARQRRGERGGARQSRKPADRHAMMGDPHNARPDVDRQAAAGRLLGRRRIVITHPNACDEMAGIADEPGVAEILAGAGLARGRPARKLRFLRGAGDE